MFRFALLAALLAGCVAHDEPDLLARFGSTGAGGKVPMVAIEGDRVYVFYDDVHVVDLVTGQPGTVGSAISAASRYDEVAVSDGWAYWLAYRWDSPDEVRIGRVTDGGNEESIALGIPPRDLVAHGGCALFTVPPAELHRWCPDEAAPAQILADGPMGDVVAEGEVYYFFAADGLTRFDAAAGTRELLGVAPVTGAELAIDGDLLVWWSATQLSAIPKGGGAPVVLGTLSELDEYPPAELSVDDAGFHRGRWRLRRGETVGDEWLPENRGAAVADGHAAWIEPTAWQYALYTLPSDASAPPPPGGEEGSVRPPFL